MYYQKLRLSPVSKFAFIDIDNTLTGNGSGTGNSQLIMQVRKLLKKKSYLFCPTTSRTEEMMMSQKTYEKSKEIYFLKRPPPKLFFDQGLYYYKDPLLVEPLGILDGEIIISSSGSKIFVKQTNNAYQEDICFYDKAFPDPQTWRNTVTTQINNINNVKNIVKLSSIEYADRYSSGTNNVYPPDYRIQLFFTSIKDKLFFISKLLKIKKSSKDVSINTLNITYDSDPKKNKISVYLTPKNGKIDAVNHVMEHLRLDLDITAPELLLVGDSWPDLEMGLFSAVDIPNGTFFLVGGSRLRNFIQTDDKGVYYYKGNGYERKVVIGDIIFPGKVGPDSLIEFLS